MVTATHAFTANKSDGADASIVRPSNWNAAHNVVVDGLLYGLTLSNNGGDATNDIDIANGVAADAGNTVSITLTAGLTKQLDVAWAVGTNAGMLATGAAVGNNTYHIFLIQRPDTGVVDIAADTSAVGANIAANTNVNYTKIRRIGSVLREAAANVAFTQYGNYFQRNTLAQTIVANNPGTSAVTRTLAVPLGILVEADIIVHVFNGAAAGSAAVLITPLTAADDAPSYTTGPTQGGAVATTANNISGLGNQLRMWTNTSGQIRSRLSFSDGNVGLYIYDRGWYDRRGT